MRSQSVAAKKQKTKKTSKKAICDFSSHGEDFSKASCQCDFIVVSTFVRYNNEITLARAEMRHADNVAAKKPKTS
jgi:hypothetical protein